MKAYVWLGNVAVAIASTAAIALLTKGYAYLASIQLAPDTLLLCALGTLLTAIVITYIHWSDRSTKMRLDLLFRMDYQSPFLKDIRHDEEERALYKAAILRRLRDLAEFKRRFGDDGLTSLYIGCLAFCANEKRANIPWQTFRDQLTKYFTDEILAKKISSHVINDHYKGMWPDLLEAAERVANRRKHRAKSPQFGKQIGKTVPKE
jgi:hypothetical protein